MRRMLTIVGAGLLVTVLGVVAPVPPGGLPPTAAGPVQPVRPADPARPTAGGDQVFRSYGGAGGLKDELAQLAAANPGIAELVTIGRTVRGQELVALKVTRDARTTRDGRRPATLFLGGQHAREWIGPELVRRLARHVVEGARSDPALAALVDTTEMWFVPVANPDGYDHSFTPGNRSWRKNLRDNDGDGRLTANDGVDLNRNYPTRWGYDDEGSSPTRGSDDYRGSRAASEPETRAVDGLMARVGFEFSINYHSATESVLYGTAWQVATPTPDDALYETMVGDAGAPAVPGYAHGLFAELYSANGTLDEHANGAYGTLAMTVEASMCETAAASDPDDAWEPAGCATAFDFPDDEALVDAEFRRNLPFALATARSAPDPADPVTVTGRRPPEFVVDSFGVSYGDPQTVAVTARRDQRAQRLHFRINGGRTRRADVAEWTGGERYGDERDRYYAELRGKVTGARPGDSVEVWFAARRDGRDVASEHFTYTVASDTGADTLILASEDYTGVNPTYPAGTSGPKYVDEYAAALDANGITHATWDVDARGAPHPLGVLSHFDAVVWETGDDRLVQDPEDAVTDTFLLGPVPDIAVAERQNAVTMAVRDHLNEGGKLVQAGENAQYHGLLGRSLGGIYHGLAEAPEEDCVITRDFLSDCLLLSDDFAQYYLGASVRAPIARPAGVDGRGRRGPTGAFGGPAVADNPLNEAGAFSLTSDELPARDHSQFAGIATSTYRGAATGNPFGPVEGARYAGALRVPMGYQRIGRTVDLTGVPATATPTLRMRLSYSTLATFHHVIVEAAPAGTDEWTTLRDLNGRTSPAPPTTCADDLLAKHPFLGHYLTSGRPCRPTGTTGAWNGFTGESNGWVDAAFDLSAYAGRKVDVKVSYVTDDVDGGVAGGIGAFVDDTRVTAGGDTIDADGFEADGGAWSVEGPPAGSPPAVDGSFAIGEELISLSSSVATRDTVLLGFGLESLATPAERARVMGEVMRPLLHPRRR